MLFMFQMILKWCKISGLVRFSSYCCWRLKVLFAPCVCDVSNQTPKFLSSCWTLCECVNFFFMYFQAPASLLLSWQSSLRPELSSRPTKSLWSVCPDSLHLLQRWAGCLVTLQWAAGSPPALLSNKQTRLSKSAAICPSWRQTGTRRRFTPVKCLWAPRLQRKASRSQSVKNSGGAAAPFHICFFSLCAASAAPHVRGDQSACLESMLSRWAAALGAALLLLCFYNLSIKTHQVEEKELFLFIWTLPHVVFNNNQQKFRDFSVLSQDNRKIRSIIKWNWVFTLHLWSVASGPPQYFPRMHLQASSLIYSCI